mgnify:CR=1 FL=1
MSAVVAQQGRRGGGEMELAAIAQQRDFLDRRLRLRPSLSRPRRQKQGGQRLQVLAPAQVLGP